jgi:hypothetical protein
MHVAFLGHLLYGDIWSCNAIAKTLFKQLNCGRCEQCAVNNPYCFTGIFSFISQLVLMIALRYLLPNFILKRRFALSKNLI